MIQKSQVKLQIMIRLLSQVDKCAKVVAVANVVLGMIKTAFLCEEKNLVLQLYKSLVRPKLEYSIQAWNPYQQKGYTTFRKGTKKGYQINTRIFKDQ